MKILRVISSMDPRSGGPPQGIRNMLPELEKLQIFQDVVCLDSPNTPYLADENICVYAIGPAKSSWGYGKNLTRWLEKNLASYDVVICHGLWQFPLLAVRKQIERLREDKKCPKFLIYPHGMLDPWFQSDPSRRIKAFRNSIYWILFERKNLNSADAVFFTCEEERRLAAMSFPGYNVKEKVVGYGLPIPQRDTDEARDAFLQKNSYLKDRKYLLFLSRIHPKKGIDILLKAYFKIVNSQNYGKFVALPDLVIAGPCESAYANEMRALVESEIETGGKFNLVATPNVWFPGMLSGDEKWGAFFGCEAFVLPSHQENFGIAVAEALACGKPVLISKRVNIWREIVSAGGGIADEDDQEGVERMLRAYLNLDTHDRIIMEEKARRCYVDNFSVELASKRFCKAVSEVIDVPSVQPN